MLANIPKLIHLYESEEDALNARPA
jgi:hypothetical protein